MEKLTNTRPSEGMVRRISRRLSHKTLLVDPNASDVDKQAAVMQARPSGLYEHFRRGLLEYHSEVRAALPVSLSCQAWCIPRTPRLARPGTTIHQAIRFKSHSHQNEREYIEACRETECLQVLQPHVAEIWRLTYVTPPPTNPRTFVVLLLSRELQSEGERCFMNISLPFDHPGCVEKHGEEKSRVRGKYVSVERVREIEGGAKVEWRMSTSSDAGGESATSPSLLYPCLVRLLGVLGEADLRQRSPLHHQLLPSQQYLRRRAQFPQVDDEAVQLVSFCMSQLE